MVTKVNEPMLKGKWNEFKGKIKQQWGKLTDDDVDRIAGERDELIGKIQQHYGKTRAEVERELDAWESKHGLR